MKPSHQLAFLSLACFATLVQSARKRPNIVYILTDDQGYADVGWDDNPTIPTPNLDQLREDGTELTQFYTHQKCTASRAALMTGRYAHTMGVHTNDVFSRYKNHTLDLNTKMFPEFLKAKRYYSHLIGKWHLGFCAVASTPTYRGFDTFFGTFSGTDNHFTQMTKGSYDWNWHRDGKLETYWPANDTYNTYLITNHTVKLIDEHFTDPKKARKPVFMFVSYVAPHIPTQAPPECIAHPKCQAIPEDDVRRTYCGMVRCVDEGVGQIVEALKRNKVFDNTIIVFHTDNGGTMKGGASNWPLRGSKTTLYEGGTRVRAILHAPTILKRAPKTYDGLIHVTDMMPTLYAAVRGRQSDLPSNLDGVNQWKRIRNNKRSGRQWMVYNLNTPDEAFAIRFRNRTHDYKLLYRNSTRCPGWNRDPRPAAFQTDGRRYRVKCSEDGYRLFNLATNPSEMEPDYVGDAAKDKPEMLLMMKRKMDELRLTEVPVPTYTELDRYGPGRPRMNNNAFGVGDCEYNTVIAQQNA